MLLIPGQKFVGSQLFEQFRSGGENVHLEIERMRKDGTMIWISATCSPVIAADGKIVGASVIARDITQRRRAEAHREILVGELNHRVKNTLAIVSAIASQTLTGAVSIKAAGEAFSSWLSAVVGSLGRN